MRIVRSADFTRSDEGYYLILRASSGAHMEFSDCRNCWLGLGLGYFEHWKWWKNAGF